MERDQSTTTVLKRFSWLLTILTGILLAACGSPEKDSVPDGMWVADGYSVEQIAGPDLVTYPMFASLAADGRLFVFESTGPNTMSTEEMLENPTYRISTLFDRDGDGFYDERQTFADSLPLPQGGHFYQGSLYVSASPDLLRLTDTTGDGVADRREVVISGWTLNVNACTLQGPFFGPDGWLYMPDCRRGFSIETREGELLEGAGARIWRVRPDGSGLEWLSGGGFDNAVELAFMPTGEVIGTMTYFTDPQHGQRDALMHWTEGGVYPKPHAVIEEDDLILTGDLMPVMTKLPRVAPSGLLRYRGMGDDSELNGDLFSAHFNTGRIIRSTIDRDGATFTTEDEEFFYSNTPRFHPTDVLEDADGSLLVLDTGGWFVQGCPLSGAAMEEATGGIYRITRTGAPAVADPYGWDLGLESMSPPELIGYVDDERPFVRDQVIERLVEAGPASVEPLVDLLESSPDVQTRIAATFALYRIGAADARQAVRNALDDPDFEVRVVAARSAGMAKDGLALERLMELVVDDEPAVRRQAATALGQIGDSRAVDALLTAAEDPEDRFVEHAIIYAMATLGSPERLAEGLNPLSGSQTAGGMNQSAGGLNQTAEGLNRSTGGLNQQPDSAEGQNDREINRRRAALIALDQMPGDHMRSDMIVPLLESGSDELRQTVLWIATRHPEWSGDIVGYLQSELESAAMSDEQQRSVGDLLVSFCGDGEVQQLIATLLQSETTPVAKRVYLMDAAGRCHATISEPVVQQIGEQLQHQDPDVQEAAIALIRSRNLSSLADQLQEIADDTAEQESLRLAALGAFTMFQPQLSDEHYRYLVSLLDPDYEVSVRQQAARILGHSELDEEQLLNLGINYLADLEPLLLTRLIEAYDRPVNNPEVGHVLIAAIRSSPDNLDSVTETQLESLFSEYPEPVQVSADELIGQLRERHESRLQRLEEIEFGLVQGDVGRGREIFFGNRAVCSTCHAVGEEGSDFGPDLTNIGEIRTRHDILEAIYFADASFAREYETWRVETSSGAHVGIMGEDLSSSAITLKVAPGATIRIDRDEIISIEQMPNSLMPSGLVNALSQQELSDLMAFLEALPYRLDRLIEQQASVSR